MELFSKRVLVCDYCPDFFMLQLQNLGFEIDYKPEITNSELFDLENVYGSILIKSALIINEEFFRFFSNMKLVFRPGSGLDNVDMKYCGKNQITVINSPNGNSNAVAEHTLGLLLSLCNNLHKAINEVRDLEWIREENRGIELFERSIAVIGVGNAGTAFCQKLKGFNVNLLPHDKYKPHIESIGLDSVPLEQVYEEAEVVSLHLPLNKETSYYANEEFFNSFKRPIYFLNTSRGGVLNTKALLGAIESGRVVKAALDVLETEPINNASKTDLAIVTDLIKTEKVLITPHIAGWTHEAKRKMFDILLHKYNSL